jgi:molybdopterin molybdotransferase
MLQAVSLEEACAASESVAAPRPEELVPLAESAGRRLFGDLRAPSDFPFFDSSAMDGWALRAGDATSSREFLVVGESRAGMPYPRVVPACAAVAIATGAQLPPGTDSVLPLEDGRQADDLLVLEAEISAGQFVREAGRHIRTGDIALPEGTKIGAAEIAALAALGCATVKVRKEFTATVIAGGDELKEPGADLEPGAIYDSNTPMLTRLLSGTGCSATAARYASDDAHAVTALLASAVESSDFVVTCGGVSVGRHDHLPVALKRLDAREVVTGTTARPGLKFRLAVATRADGTDVPVFCLPGNPLSAWFCFQVYVRRYLSASLSAAAPQRVEAVLAATLDRAQQRTRLVPGRLSQQDVTTVFTPSESTSDAATSIAGCDAYAIIEPGDGVANKWLHVECERADG